MNLLENIAYLASSHGKGMRPKRKEEIHTNIPYFSIQKSSDSCGWDVIGHNYETHDNASRMDLYTSYLKHAILPNIRGDPTGYYNIELHDSYTYLDNGKDYTDVFTFSKFKTDTKPVLLPDPYMITNWGGKSIQDKQSWEAKIDRVCFFGTTTGNRDPTKNRRIQMCLWAAEDGGKDYDFRITHIAQMSLNDIINKIKEERWKKIYTPLPIPPEVQLGYKFFFLPDGNTCKFDTWYFNTNSLNFKDESTDMLWYFPLLYHMHHFVEVTHQNIGKMRKYYLANPKEAKHIISNAQKAATELFRPFNHIYYTTELFQTIVNNK